MKNRTTFSNSDRRRGFTMVELMVVIAVLGAILVLAAPGYQALILNNRSLSEVYALRATLSNARSEAIARRAPVVVCPTSDGAACDAALPNWLPGYMSFVDTNNDTVPDPNDPDEEIIQYEARGVEAILAFDNANNLVRFSPRGDAITTQGTFSFCDERGAGNARALILNAVGSVRSAEDTDDDGIVNDAGGTNVGC